MVALSGLNTAAILLQQIVVRQETDAQQPDAAYALTQIGSGNSEASGPAEKSAISAIFNAVASLTEKQNESVKAVLAYIDREYTHCEDKVANILKMYPNDVSLRDGLAAQKAAGERLKQEVLADPVKIYTMLQQVRTSRPDVSLDDAIGLMIADLGNEKSRKAEAAAQRAQSSL